MKKIFFYILCTIVVLGIIIIGVVMYFFCVDKIIRPGAIGHIKTNVSDDVITITGEFALESSKAYKKYNYRVHENNIYITVYGVLVSSRYNSGSFEITIEGEFSEIKNIYIEGEGEQLLIWEQET